MTTASAIVRAALDATTVDNANALQDLIAGAVGARYVRPLGDRDNNNGLLAQSGNFDWKLIEPITNMQDAVVERRALEKFGHAARVPYRTPQDAVAALMPGTTPEQGGDLATVVFTESDQPASKSKRLTVTFRDQGSGLTPAAIPLTIFQLGGSLKDDRLWQQGAFGLGGATTYRNARAVVLVSRRAPELLAGAEDRISVAVVLWREMTKGTSAYYLVTQPWNGPGDIAEPWSCPAAQYPDFAPGTHLTLVSYGVQGLHRNFQGDERSFDTIVNTRLFRPLFPIRWRNDTDRHRNTALAGFEGRLQKRVDEGTLPHGEETLPFNIDGTTHQLPVSFWLFAAGDVPGSRRKFAVAKDHVVLFTSNGQVHHHWDESKFRSRTKLNKLAGQVLVEVRTDALDIRVRTSLFTPDRADLVATAVAVKLEEAVAGFLDGWDTLVHENSRLVRESLKGGGDPKLQIAQRISRVLEVRGFGAGTGEGTAGSKQGQTSGGSGLGGSVGPKTIDLHDDPTYIKGPTTKTLQVGTNGYLTVEVDAVNEFWTSGRGRLSIECDHPSITAEEIGVGMANAGRTRISIPVPDTAATGIHELRVGLSDWLSASGGLGKDLMYTCKLDLVEETVGHGTGGKKPAGSGNGDTGPGTGNRVALFWEDADTTNEWGRSTVGSVETVKASDLAVVPAYASLASLGDEPVTTLRLSNDFAPWKQYLGSRSKKLVDTSRPMDQYAVGVGVELILLQKEIDRRTRKGLPVDGDFVKYSSQAAAKAIIAVMPAFDDLLKEAGLDS